MPFYVRERYSGTLKKIGLAKRSNNLSFYQNDVELRIKPIAA